MSTITLEEALSRVTNGERVAGKSPSGVGHAIFDWSGEFIADLKNHHSAFDAALLAHCYNHFPEVVKALEEYVSFDRCICDELEVECQHCLSQAILNKAETVTIPD